MCYFNFFIPNHGNKIILKCSIGNIIKKKNTVIFRHWSCFKYSNNGMENILYCSLFYLFYFTFIIIEQKVILESHGITI